MNKECENCFGKCCVGIIEVFPEDEIYFDASLSTSLKGFPTKVMITDSSNRCIAQSNGKCSIYSKRPKICKLFKINSPCCIGFRNGDIKEHECFKCNLY